jgi:hypothetical protein
MTAKYAMGLGTGYPHDPSSGSGLGTCMTANEYLQNLNSKLRYVLPDMTGAGAGGASKLKYTDVVFNVGRLARRPRCRSCSAWWTSGSAVKVYMVWK